MSKEIQDDLFSDAKSEILFNVKQCEELFQMDKSEKLKQDIETFKTNIFKAKQSEIEFYQTLLLEDGEKERIFGIRNEQQIKMNEQQRYDDEKVIVWDPLQGNLIMTYKEYKEVYDP